jgi:hypothetical protein
MKGHGNCHRPVIDGMIVFQSQKGIYLQRISQKRRSLATNVTSIHTLLFLRSHLTECRGKSSSPEGTDTIIIQPLSSHSSIIVQSVGNGRSPSVTDAIATWIEPFQCGVDFQFLGNLQRLNIAHVPVLVHSLLRGRRRRRR